MVRIAKVGYQLFFCSFDSKEYLNGSADNIKDSYRHTQILCIALLHIQSCNISDRLCFHQISMYPSINFWRHITKHVRKIMFTLRYAICTAHSYYCFISSSFSSYWLLMHISINFSIYVTRTKQDSVISVTHLQQWLYFVRFQFKWQCINKYFY